MLAPEKFRALTFRDDEAIVAEIRCHQTQRDDQVMKALAQKDPNYSKLNGIVQYKGLIYVPKDKKLRERVISCFHNTIMAGHPGWHKTVKLITCDYWWPSMSGQVSRYVAGCTECQGAKVRSGPAEAPLNPQAIPDEPWQNVSVDFIGPITPSLRYNMIMVVVDMLTKETILIPTTQNITAEGTARLFFKHIIPLKGLFRKVVSDRGPQFAANFTKDLYKLLQIERNLSTAYHPQTDGQTERLNQEIKKYLCIFINEQQTDWAEWLPMAQFALNNQVNCSTGHSPFYLNNGCHPFDGFCPQRVKVKRESAEEFAQGIHKVMEDAKATLKIAQDQMKADYNRHRRPSHKYKVGDKAWVCGEQIKTTRPSKKLDWKWYGPFEIIEKVNQGAYQLKLPVRCSLRGRHKNQET